MIRIAHTLAILQLGLLCRELDVGGEVTCPAGKADSKSECGNGAYLNICGVCVGGGSGRPTGEGLDRCGVCGGDDECVGCDGQPNSGRALDACGRCLLPEDAQWNDCVRISRVSPSVLDRAVLEAQKGVATLSLRGARLNRTAVPDLSCTLHPAEAANQQEAPKIEMTTVEDDVIQLEIIVSKQQGTYYLQCNSSAVNNLTSNLTLILVDSKLLSVSEVNPTVVTVEKSFQPILMVPNIAGHSKALCFVRTEGSENTEILEPMIIEGTKIVCSNYTAHQAQVLEIGASFTEEAATQKESQGTTGKIIVQASKPTMKEAILTNDLQYIHIIFDQNVNGPEECDKIMNPFTMTLLGQEPSCSFTANQLIIKLGKNPSVRENTQLQLAEDCSIYRANSDPKLCSPARGQIQLRTPPVQSAKPKYRVSAPKVICPEGTSNAIDSSKSNFYPSFVRLVSSNGQHLQYIWEIDVSNLSEIPNRGQAKNLRIWRNVRGMAKEMKRVSNLINGNQFPLNSSLFEPELHYEFNVIAKNILGMKGEKKKFSVQRDESRNTVDIVLFGPDIILVDADYYVDAKVFTCNESFITDDLTYEWAIMGDVALDADLTRGKRLHLPAGILNAGRKYILTCTVKTTLPEETVLGKGNLTIETIQRPVTAVLATSQQTLGTGQLLYLDASASEDPNKKKGNLKFQWCCQTTLGNQCTMPGPGNPLPLQEKYNSEFKRSKLILPQKSLSIGEYNFTVHAYKDDNDIGSAWTKVIVVQGSPPMVNVTPDIKHLLVDPSEGVTIQAEVTNIKPDCFLWWEVVQETGFQYFDLKGDVGLGDVVKVTEEEANSGQPRELPLSIPQPIGSWPGLLGDTKYKLRLTATCPVKGSKMKQISGYADVIIQTNTPPVTKPLQVIPDHGEALRTQFEFSTDEAYDSVSDMPLQYNFGYRISEEETNIFSSSNEEFVAYTFLPAGDMETQKETFITPILQVCDSHKICTLSEGRKVKTTAPNKFSSAEVEKILKMLSNYLTTGQYTEALSLTKASLQTLKKMNDDDLYNKVSQQIEKTLLQELKIRKERLKDNPSTIQDSLDFTNTAVSILKDSQMSDNILQELFDFKEEIVKVIDNSIYGQKYRLKRNIPNVEKKRYPRDTGITRLNDATKQVENILFLNENMIKHHNQTNVKAGIDALLRDIPTLLQIMCTAATPGKPEIVGGNLLILQVEKHMTKSVLTGKQISLLDKISPPTLSTFSFVKLSPNLIEACKSPVCFGNTLLLEDILEIQMKNENFDIDFSRNTFVYGIWLIFEKKILALKNVTVPTQFRLPLQSITEHPAQKLIQCAAWNGGWKTEFCKTNDISTNMPSPYVDCECIAPTFYRIVAVERTTTTSTTTTSIPTTVITTPTTTLTSTTQTSTTSTTTTTTTTPTTQAPTTEPTTLAKTSYFPSTIVELFTTINTPPPIIPTTFIPSSTITTSSPKTTNQISSIIDSTSRPRVEGKPTSDSYYNVTFRIDEDFLTTVGEQKEEFKASLYDQILNQVDMPSKMIKEITILPGSIIIKMTLVDTDIKSVEEVLPLIKEVLSSGKLNVYGLDNRKLNVPPQNIQIVHDNSHENGKIITYAVGGTVGVSTCAIAALLITAVIYRRKKEKDRMKQFQASAQNKIPTYRKFEYEESIDGSDASLAQYRSGYPMIGTVSTMMGFGMLTGLGTQLNIIPQRTLRYEEHNNSIKQQQNTEKGVDVDSGNSDNLQTSTSTTKRKRRNRSKSGATMASLDNLPGTPTDDSR